MSGCIVSERNALTRGLVVALLLWIAACDSGSSSSGGRGSQFAQTMSAAGTNALGESVSLRQFSGKYVWVDYAAEWCASCGPQSQAIRSLAVSAPDSVVFITVMTSEVGGYGHPATQDTAARWAQRLSLQPEHVVAADLTSLTLPQHRLFGPEGRELYSHAGQLPASRIREVLAKEGQRL